MSLGANRFPISNLRANRLSEEGAQQSYYWLAVVMCLFFRAVDDYDEWPVRLMELFHAHSSISPAQLGFPADWESDPIWN